MATKKKAATKKSSAKKITQKKTQKPKAMGLDDICRNIKAKDKELADLIDGILSSVYIVLVIMLFY